MGPTTANEMKNLRKGRGPGRKMAYSIGNYKGYQFYQLEKSENIPAHTDAIYVDIKGALWYGGVNVGKVRLPGYTVIEFDMGIYDAWKKARETRQKEVAVPACVAMSTVDLATGEEIDLLGSDEFFARIALEIEETLKGARQ